MNEFAASLNRLKRRAGRSTLAAVVVAALAVAALGATIARGADPQLKTVPRVMQSIPVELRVTVSKPMPGTRAEVHWIRVQGRVELRSGAAREARVEMGFMQGREDVASKTITVPVPGSFSEMLEMPGDGPYTFYAGIVRLSSVVRADDVGLRPPGGRDLSSGSRPTIRIQLVDDRGRIMDGRVVVYQGGAIIGERHTAGGRAELYDLAPGVYTVRATSIGGWTGSRDDVRVTSSGESVYVMTLYPPE
jgi:hypothetical protein